MFFSWIKKNQNDIILAIGVILISLFSFLTGFITAKYQEKQPIIVEDPKQEYEEINVE